MITVITGQPGNGKTLHTLGLVEALRVQAEREGQPRPVYYAGIPELTLPWIALDDAASWHEVPNGSLIVIDECQRIFPVRKQGAAVPAHVSPMETHRHRGLDLFLITQHPQLVDIAVRKLAGRHLHLRRTFGREVSTVLQWERCVDPNDRSVKNEALVSSFPFPRERYGWYKSADMHTVRKSLPWKKFAVLGGSLAGVVLIAAYVVNHFSAMGEEEATREKVSQAANVPRGGYTTKAGRSFEGWAFAPRMPFLPWSAPFYDDVQGVESAPRVTGCYSHRWSDGRLECRCTTQQGSRADIPRDLCMQYLERGVFDGSRPDADPKAYNVAKLEARDAAAMQQESGAFTSTAQPAPEASRGGERRP